MKKTGFFILMLLLGSSMIFAQNDAITSHFNDLVEDEDFSTVYVSPEMFKLVAKFSDDNSKNDIAEISKDIKTLRILSTEKTPQKFYKKANKLLNSKNYDELMTIKDKGQNIRFVTQTKGDIIQELVLIIGSEKDFTMVDFTGIIDLDKISQLAGKLNINGSNELGRLNRK